MVFDFKKEYKEFYGYNYLSAKQLKFRTFYID